MKKISYVIYLFLISLFFVEIVFADEKDYIYYESKTVEKICKYSKDLNISVAPNSKEYVYLYIYDDGSASIGWNAGWCARTNNKGKCADGYNDNGKTISGIMNWSDVYAKYSEDNKCPGYLAKSENYADNRFLLSIGNDASSLKDIEDKNASYPGNKKGIYYCEDSEESEKYVIDDDLTCEYELSGEAHRDVSKNQTIYFKKDGSVTTNGSSVISSKMKSSEYTKLLEDNKCPKKLDACLKQESIPLGGGTQYYLKIYGDLSVTTETCDNENFFELNCIGDNCSEKIVCQLYSDYEEILKLDLQAYKTSTDKITPLNSYNKHKSEFSKYCESIVDTLNYEKGGCVDGCLKLIDDLYKLELDAGLQSAYKNQECNIGEQVLSMVYNVLKWAKYIAPVLVIILSILDFIKAIAAQSDDEMKKAQGKFVKRLIVAALLFLLPLIINFALKTFGMYNSSCDITDLF